jgi:hypothetical protein
VGAEFFHANKWAGRQTNIMKLIVTYRNFTEALKNDLPRENYFSTTTSSLFSVPLLCKVLEFYVSCFKVKQTVPAVAPSETDQSIQQLMM